MPPRVPSVKATSMGISEGDMSQSQAPLRRKTSMGSFQKGMGESLTGRLRKQLDIPKGPKLEINTNIPIEQIQSLKYLAQVRDGDWYASYYSSCQHNLVDENRGGCFACSSICLDLIDNELLFEMRVDVSHPTRAS